MTGSKNVITTFTSLEWMRVKGNDGTFYGTLIDAFAAASNGNTIQTKALTFTESPVFNRQDVTITLEGGRNSDWAPGGFTVIQGSFHIRNGRVNVNGIKLRQ